MCLGLGMWGYVGISKQVPRTLPLKGGTQVILLRNLDLWKGIRYGTRGATWESEQVKAIGEKQAAHLLYYVVA